MATSRAGLRGLCASTRTATRCNNPYAMFRRAITAEAFAKAQDDRRRRSACWIRPASAMARRRWCWRPTAIVAPAQRRPPAGAHRALRPAPPMPWPCMTGATRCCCRRRSSRRQRAYAQAGVGPRDIDFFELHDAFTIMAALSLEAGGFRRARPGRAAGHGRRHRPQRRASPSAPWAASRRAAIRWAPPALPGRRGRAATARRGGRQPVTGCRLGMTQNIGGSGANVITHILERV